MRGLLADVNVQGHLPYLRRLLRALDLIPVLDELSISLVTLPDLKLPRDVDDRSLWDHCQVEGWVLFTENRNRSGEDSLQATLMDSWQPGKLPVLTLASKTKFEHVPAYAIRVATDIAELLLGISHGEYRDQP